MLMMDKDLINYVETQPGGSPGYYQRRFIVAFLAPDF